MFNMHDHEHWFIQTWVPKLVWYTQRMKSSVMYYVRYWCIDWPIMWSLHQTWVPNSKLTSYIPHACTCMYMYNKKHYYKTVMWAIDTHASKTPAFKCQKLTMHCAGCSLPVLWNDLGTPWGPERPACKPSTGCATEREGHKGRCVLDNSGKWRAFSERRVYKH